MDAEIGGVLATLGDVGRQQLVIEPGGADGDRRVERRDRVDRGAASPRTNFEHSAHPAAERAHDFAGELQAQRPHERGAERQPALREAKVGLAPSRRIDAAGLDSGRPLAAVALTSLADIRYAARVDGEQMSRTNWVRYCVPREDAVRYDSDGFPHDPQVGGDIFQPSATSLTKVLRAPCVVLIGEPGIGKSDTMQQLSARAAERGGPSEFVDLVDGTGAELFSSEPFRGWRQGRPLELYIDSLEDDPRFWLRLRKELQDARRRSHLRLRIACRTGALPELLDRELPELWGKGNVEVYELMPLCPRDIRLIAGDDADEFLDGILRRGISPLAIRPVYLNFLLRQFREHRELPATRWQLYEDGCRLLCKENNLVRKSVEPRDAPNSHRRVDIASRIAAVCVLAGRPLIQRVSDCDEPDSDTVLWMDLSNDDATDSVWAIDDQAVRDTLHGTSLFSSRGPERLGFAHSSYASFLAARYMKSRAFRLEDLTAACAGPEFAGPIPIAIRDVAGWLASEDAEARRWLLTHDARVLLMSDLHEAADDERAALVAKLLELAEHSTLPVHDLRAHYRRLAYPGLAEQLRPWLQDRHRAVWARHVAIEMAGACGCKELEPSLIGLVLTQEEPAILRADAFDELLRVGELAALRALRPLLLEPDLSAPNAWVRGQLIRALWPDHLPDDELLEVLDAMHMRGRASAGELDWFIERTLVPKASDQLVFKLFDRLRASALSHHSGTIGLLGEQLVARALTMLDDPGMLAALARFASVCLAHHTNPFWSSHRRGHRSRIASLTTSERRRLVQAIVENTAVEIKAIWLRLYHLVDARDTAWMIARYLDAPDQASTAQWLRMIADMVFEHPPAAESDAEALLYTAAERSIEFKAALWCWFGPIEFGWDSTLATELITAHEQRLRRRAERRRDKRQRRAAQAEVRTRLVRLIAAIRTAPPESEPLGALLHELRYFERDAAGYPEDVLDMAAWRVLPANSRARFQELAAEFLRANPLVEPETWQWDKHYRLLRFMQGLDPEWAPRQSVSLWEGWTPAIVCEHEDGEAVRSALLREAHGKLPGLVRWCLAVCVARATRELEVRRICRSAKTALDDEAVAFMKNKLADDDYSPEPLSGLLMFLREQEMPGIEDELHRLLDVELSDPRRRGRACVAARHLWELSADFSWSVLAPRFEADPTFGEEVVGLVAQGHWSLQAETWDRNHEEAVAQVYAWMVQRFPEAEDPALTMRLGDTDRYQIGQLRHTLLVNLQSRRTPSSLAAILRLQKRFPDEMSLPYNAGFARDHVAEKQWRPLTPRQAVHLRRRRANEPMMVSILLARTISEIQRIAKVIDPKLADDLPLGSSREAIVDRLIQGVRRHFSTLTEACECIRGVVPELSEELAQIAESLEEQAYWTIPVVV